MNIYLIVPSYNEGKRLRDILKHAKKHFPCPFIVITDQKLRKHKPTTLKTGLISKL